MSGAQWSATCALREHQAERREKVRRLLAEGRSGREVGAIVGVSERTVDRDRRALGLPITVPAPFVWTARAEWWARHAIADECPLTEIARTIGAMDHRVVRRRFKAETAEWKGSFNPIAGYSHIARELGLQLGQIR